MKKFNLFVLCALISYSTSSFGMMSFLREETEKLEAWKNPLNIFSRQINFSKQLPISLEKHAEYVRKQQERAMQSGWRGTDYDSRKRVLMGAAHLNEAIAESDKCSETSMRKEQREIATTMIWQSMSDTYWDLGLPSSDHEFGCRGGNTHHCRKFMELLWSMNEFTNPDQSQNSYRNK